MHHYALYDDNANGVAFADDAAMAKALRAGTTVADPNGSYSTVLTRAGFKNIELMDSTSSAGDWSGTAEDADGEVWTWYQQNRYPFHGYTVAVISGNAFAEERT